MKTEIMNTESFFARIMIVGTVIFGFDRVGSSQDEEGVCLKFTYNLTEATKYSSADDSRKEKLLMYDPKVKMITLVEELEDEQMRMGRIVGEEKIKAFYDNLHIIEVEATIKVKDLLRR